MKIYNTLSKSKEELIPVKKGHISMYVCGPTVYDLSHIGHARTYISFDIIKRYLEYIGFKVKYIINITDVDDKILDRAKKEKITPGELTTKMIQKFKKDFLALKNEKPEKMPKVTENVLSIIQFIEILIKKGFAYEVNGNVYFAVRKFPEYGRLSNNNIEDLVSGVRIEPLQKKYDPLDFALWKKAKEKESISFDSPWGKGRPGWHIECSAIANEYLGKTIDIHGGGNDLIFPHHEDEKAQSEAANEVPFAKFWIHTGMVTVNGQKMSKSLGNFITVKKILQKITPEALRFHVIKTHYRSPLDFDEGTLEASIKSLTTLKEFAKRISEARATSGRDSKITEKYEENFFAALDDDFNTPKALAIIFEYIREVNKLIDLKKLNKDEDKKSRDFLKKIDGIFGLELFSKEQIPDKIRELLSQRELARNKKDWRLADKLRLEVEEEGFEIEDTSRGAKVRRK